MNEEFVATPVGTARITWYPARGSMRAVALLGHGSATGIESADLQALAGALPPQDVTVALVTQPYRLRANPGAADEASLDLAWTAVWPAAARAGVPVIAGGSHELLATGRPTLVVQGGSDPFGRPGQFPRLPPEIELAEIPSANHTFGTPPGIPRSASMTRITVAVTEWIDRQLPAAHTP